MVRAMWRLLPLCVLLCGPAGALPPDEDTPTDPVLGEDDEDPLQLGPVDDELRDLLLGGDGASHDPFDDVTLITAGRLRVELLDVDVQNDATLAPQLVLSGRAGLALPLGDHRVTVVLGDGVRLGEGLSAGSVSALNPLYEVKLDLSLGAFGQPATVTVGRMAYQVADGRYLGHRWFHPRFGVTYDGAAVSLPLGPVLLRGAAFYLGPYDALDAQKTSFVTAVDGNYEETFFDWLHIETTAYGLAHKDGTPERLSVDPINVGTLGARVAGTAYGAFVRAGLDGQVQVRDDNPLAPAGQAVHGETSIGYAPRLSLFDQTLVPRVEIAAESTWGTAVAGRVLRLPNGAVHVFLGNLDLFAPDNITAATALIGATVNDRLACDLSVHTFLLTDPGAPLIGAQGDTILPVDPSRSARFVGTEVDGTVSLRVHEAIQLVGQYGIILFGDALPNRPVTQRLLMWVEFQHDVGGG